MTLGLAFLTPLLLLGLLAAGIPFILHLLSSIRAQEVYYPTLRFLKVSMEKTAARRRIQHWLLLALRAALLGLLAIAVAEPVSKALGGWLSGQRYAAVVILDNSLSMAAQSAGAPSRLSAAKAEASALLSDDNKPAQAAVLTTNGGINSRELTGELDALRDGVNKAQIGYGAASLSQKVSAAVAMLAAQSIPQKSIYLFTDLQKISSEELITLRDLADARDVHLFVVNVADKPVNNVGIADLQVAGQRVVDSVLEFRATLVNSSPTDKKVNVSLHVGGQLVGQPVAKTLSAAGREGSAAAVVFRHRFGQAGPADGEVVIESSDDLPDDNIRRFSLQIGGRVKALVVRGAAGEAGLMGPAVMLRLALDPYAGGSGPWPIVPQVIEADKLTAAAMEGTDAVFLCDVPRFSDSQAAALEQFARAGGTVGFFLGPNTQADNYNDVFVQKIKAEGGLLPGRLAEAVGQVGPNADAVKLAGVDVTHPYLERLYENAADYLTVLVQRHYRLGPSANPGRVLMRLAGGDPLLLVKPFGAGRVILCTTTASPAWSNLTVSGMFVPMLLRLSLMARQDGGGDGAYLSGSQVVISAGRNRPLAGGNRPTQMVEISPPQAEDGKNPAVIPIPLQQTAEGQIATFTEAHRPGFYHWRLTNAAPDDPAAAGTFAVNPSGAESRMEAIPMQTFVQAMRNHGVQHAYAGNTLAAATAAAASEAQGHNWWDTLLAAVILLLVVEAVAANRHKHVEDIIPAHLNPRVSG